MNLRKHSINIKKIMKKNTLKTAIIFSLFISLLSLNSCKKEDNLQQNDNNTTTYGNVKIEFEHQWAMSGAEFKLNDTLFHPMKNEKLYFTTFEYYVSNIKFKKSDGTWWSHPESYFLLDASNSNSLILNISNVPTATYTEMQYTMGVDSTRNVSGAQTGALSTSNNMFWTWNSGYIMLKAEGKSPNSSTGDFSLHLGGFKGSNNIVTVKNTNFNGAILNVSPSATPQIHLIANPARLWHTIDGVSTKNNITMPGADAKQAATDFYNNISFDHIHP